MNQAVKTGLGIFAGVATGFLILYLFDKYKQAQARKGITVETPTV